MNDALDCMISGVDGFPGYLVTSKGGIIGKKGRYLSPYKHNGYMNIILRANGVGKLSGVHRLVAKAFIPNPDNKPYVNHKDGVKHNNDISNLEWVTMEENQEHAFLNGLSSKQRMPVAAYDLEMRLVKVFGSMMDAERETGILSGSVSKACKRNGGIAGGLRWSKL